MKWPFSLLGQHSRATRPPHSKSLVIRVVLFTWHIPHIMFIMYYLLNIWISTVCDMQSWEILLNKRKMCIYVYINNMLIYIMHIHNDFLRVRKVYAYRHALAYKRFSPLIMSWGTDVWKQIATVANAAYNEEMLWSVKGWVSETIFLHLFKC